MGTAGGIRHAARGRVSDTFLALNGDILADAPLADLVAAHRACSAVATIALTPVADPSRYGLVRTEPGGRVLGFLEKPEPAQIDTNLINAGAYVLEAGVLDLIEDGQAVSIERETFPSLVGSGLFALAQGGYWSDVGTPESYIAAHHDLLDGRMHSDLPGLMPGACWIDEGASVSPDAVLEAPCHVAEGAVVAAGAHVGAGSSIAADAEIGVRAQLRGAVVQERARVGEGAIVAAAVIGPGAQIGAGARIGAGAVVGAGVSIPAGAEIAEDERVFAEGVR
jgi:mannose-1-phosphate guanylyltransferase